MTTSPNEIPCRQDGVNPDDWHCYDKARTERAVTACGACPIREACLQEALESEVRDGVWGGSTEQERRAIFASRRAVESARRKTRRRARARTAAVRSAA